MSSKKHKERKDLIMLIGGLVIVVLCVLIVAWLIYQFMLNDKTVPEYYLTIFVSIATLIIGYTLGNYKNE